MTSTIWISISTHMITLLTSKDIQITKLFYQCLGIDFIAEKHGEGPAHFSICLKDAVFEIYPKLHSREDNIIFRIEVDHIEDCIKNLTLYGGKILESINQSAGINRALVEDPDGRILRIIEK